MNVVHCFMNYAIFRELCDQMRFEVDCAKSHHRVIPEGLILGEKKIMACRKSSLANENYHFTSHKPTGNKSQG